MKNILNVFGFTGTIWEVPDIDSMSVKELIDKYTYIYYTIKSGDINYLGTRESINTSNINMIARNVLEQSSLNVELESAVELVCSQYDMVLDSKEEHGIVTFPSGERIIMNGNSYLYTSVAGDDRYSIDIIDSMIGHKDPVIGTADVFRDCELMDINRSNLISNYKNSLLLIGGMLMEVRSIYTFLGNGIGIRPNISGWLPTLYKNVSENISPHECGLNYPIYLDDLKDVELLNKLLHHDSSALVVFNTDGPVSMERNLLSKLFPDTISGIVSYNGRPSPNRVTELLYSNKCPTKKMTCPVYKDLEDYGDALVTIEHVVEDVSPEETSIKFIKYKVK